MGLFSLENPLRFAKYFTFGTTVKGEAFSPKGVKLSDEIINVEDLQRDIEKVFTTIQTR